MAQEKTVSITVENTPEGWARLSSQGKGKQKISVTTQICGALDDQQLFSLRYCFIALDQLEVSRKSPVSLTLHISTDQVDDAFRIRHYFAIMTVFRNVVLEITCGKTRLEGLKRLSNDYYRIMPLLCVGSRQRPWEIHYLEMTSPGDISRMQALIHTSFQSKSPMVPVYRDQSARNFLDQSLMNNLWNLQRCISGDSGGSMKDDVKQKLREELCHVLKAEMPRLCLLAQLLWSLFLRSLSDSKDLFYRDSYHRWQINKETLRCSRLDAATYAEGILQLMENACIHSDMRRSYFTLRLRDVDITGDGIVRVANAAQTRADIYERYTRLWQKLSAQSGDITQAEGIPNYQLGRQAKFCLEFSVLNDSTSSSGGLAGISQMFARNRGKDPKEMTLTKVFSYQCERISDVSKHYGLRLLEKTVQLNGGFFSVNSPGTEGKQEWYGSFFSDEFKHVYYQCPLHDIPCTDFDGLLPLYPHWHSISEPTEGSFPPSSLFQREELGRKKYRQHVLQFQVKVLMDTSGKTYHPLFLLVDRPLGPEAVSQANRNLTTQDSIGWSAGKDTLIKRIWLELRETVSWHTGEDLYLLDLMQIRDILSLELLAKAIFLLVAWEEKEKRDNLRLALLLPNEMLISEFIRIFSIFYDKQLSNGHWMGDTQIALCGYSHDSSNLPQVLFLLAGDTSGSARVTARTFAYYNTGAVLDLIPQIRYLTRTETAASVPQFPFDLALTAVSGAQAESEQISWFLRQIQQALSANLWQRSHGCRIHGIRVRLHSNIYLSDFYEAELLFHNVGIIYRFAHLIVSHLLQQFAGKPPEYLVVVGYEFYSSVLIEQITHLLSGLTTVHYLIYSAERQDEHLHLSPHLKTMDEKLRIDFLKSANYVAVVPIGTTMSTLYQIAQEVQAQWQGNFPYINYVLILVGQEGAGTLSSKYWSKKPNSPGHLLLQPQRKNAPGLQCRYYLEPQTNWSQEPPNHGTGEEVLVYVDKTSTRPKEIFVVENPRFNGTSYFLRTSEDRKENDRRLELFRGLIHYGHIAEGNNHFQFYFDMDQYFSRAQQKDPDGKRKTVDQWLQRLRAKVDPNAYNIIISPLHQEDSPFAKAVIDQVFEHSLRFLHIDLAESFREDVRAKFSYISDEYRKIKQFDRNKPVNIYFINTAITSGSALTRARNLVAMLMEESGMKYSREDIFKGCFVLVNRSAFDTVNSYVSNPEEYFFAYLHLAVPSFNIRRDHCPTCDLLDRYRALEYSSVGNFLGQEFRRLRVKHAKRTMEEHQRWLESAAMSSGGYAGWLRQWLYSYIRTRHQRGGKLCAGIFEIDEATYGDLNALYALLKWGMEEHLDNMGLADPGPTTFGEDYLNALNTFSLRQLEEIIATDRKQASKIVGKDHLQCLQRDYWEMVLTDYVYAQKSYLRLVSTHRTFLRMDAIAGELTGDIPQRGEQTARILAELMESELKKASTYHLKAECLISYLKIISRPHLAQYHHIRQGILTLMLHMTAYAIGATNELRSDLAFAKPFLRPDRKEELICCQVLQTLLKRLAGLQSTYFLRDEIIAQVLAAFSRLRESFLTRRTSAGKEYQVFNPIPTKKQVERNMIKMVKWVSSCGDDENGCYLIEENFLGKGDA